ncbi:serine hydrolase domain-containing protein [Chryseobacterium culicis]|uniref:serine hydrolase domain-containing protein n=1 Tax=Chryseobacterium culicis TaxID=680127 RepID=UPI001428A722|nr:serine hydrolase [Chryseobacterium culicis]
MINKLIWFSLFFSKAYGFSDIKNKIPFTERTIMPIASVSKTVIALSLAKAIEMAYFDVETPINDILPFKIVNPHYPNDTIRIKHLFTHTSGIVDNQSTFINSYELATKLSISMGVFLKNCLYKNGKDFNVVNFGKSRVGNKYNYSNIASDLAAYLVELKSGISFAEFTYKYIFSRLSLQNTHWFFDENKSKDYAKLYEINTSNFPFYKNLMNDDKTIKDYTSIIYPDGSLKTSLDDLIRYVKEIINCHNSKSKILNKESYKTIFKKRFDEMNFPANVDKSLSNQAMFGSTIKKVG